MTLLYIFLATSKWFYNSVLAIRPVYSHIATGKVRNKS